MTKKQILGKYRVEDAIHPIIAAQIAGELEEAETKADTDLNQYKSFINSLFQNQENGDDYWYVGDGAYNYASFTWEKKL